MNILSRIKRVCSRKKLRKMANRVNIKDLKKIFILSELKRNDNFLQILLSYCYILAVAEDEVIYKEGDNSDEMYIVLEGAVRIFKQTLTGEQLLLVELNGNSGSYFGEMGLVYCQKRSATVRAATDAKLLVLSRKDFIRMAQKQPSIAIGLTLSICRVLAKRLERTSGDLAYLYDALAYEVSEV